MSSSHRASVERSRRDPVASVTRRTSAASSVSTARVGNRTSKLAGPQLSVNSSRRTLQESSAEINRIAQVIVYDEFGNNVTPMSLLNTKPSVLKVPHQFGHAASPGAQTPTGSDPGGESFERLSSAGFSRSGISVGSSGTSTPEPRFHDLRGVSTILLAEVSGPVSPRPDEAEAAARAEGDRQKRGHILAPAAPAPAHSPSHAVTSTVEDEEEVPLTEADLAQDVVIVLEETPTFFLLEIPGACFSVDSTLAAEVTERNNRYTAMKKARASSDIYVERSAQTLPRMLKTKDVQAMPAATKEAGVRAAVWDIYDAYKIQEEPNSPVDGMSNNQGTEDKSGLVGGDKDVGDGIESESVDGSDATTERTKTDLVESDALKESLRIIERLVQQNVFHQRHLAYRNYLTYADAVSSTVTEVADEPHTIDLLWSMSCSLTAGRNVTSMAWNRLKTDLLAVGYGQFDFGQQRDGLILFWSLKNPEFPERSYSVPCGVTAIAFSATHPNLLAAGLYDGSVVIYDVRKSDSKPVLESSHTTGKHSDAVWDLRWVDKGSERGESLVSISMDGRITQWSMKKGLEHTDLMNLKRVNKQASKGAGEAKSEAFISRKASGLGFDFSPKDPNIYVAGTEDGNMHRCSCSYNEQYLESYVGHSGPVYRIRWSPFSQDAFISCSADWTVKLWSEDSDKPVLTFQSCMDYVADICWSPINGTVFAAVTGDGRLEVWDLSISTLDPIIVHQIEGKKPSAVLFALNSPVVVVGDSTGAVDVYRVRGFDPEDVSEDTQRSRLDRIILPIDAHALL